MALPVILVNATGGSDTAASGAGPATALTGSNASFAAAVVTLDGSPDLSGVAVDGSHALYLLTSTGVRFFKITAKDDGADTVTVTPNPAGTATGLTWAIGGKRASIGSASSVLLFDNGGAAGDMGAGWVVEMESGHTESLSARIDYRGPGDTTDGPKILRGPAGAATRPVITTTNDFVQRDDYWRFVDFDLTGSGATDAFVQVGSVTRLEGLLISGFSGVLIQRSGATGVQGCQVLGCHLSGGSVGIRADQNAHVVGCRIEGQSSHGIATTSGGAALAGLTIASNLIYGCGGDGVHVEQTRTDSFASVVIDGNTIDDCTGDGIEYSGDNDGINGLAVLNNLLTNNGGYGLNFASLTAAKVLARNAVIKGNTTFGNTSGACNLSGVLEGGTTTDPDYVNAGAGDYTPQEATLEGTAFPTEFDAVTNYGGPGAVQPQGAGGGVFISSGMTGGMQG